MTPNFSFQESCCRCTGVFNIPPPKKKKKNYSSCSFFGLEIIVFRFPVIDSSPVFRINSGLPMKATSPQSLASRRLNSGRFFSPMEISTKKRIFGIDVYKTQFSMILCPNFRIILWSPKIWQALPPSKKMLRLSTSGVPRNRPSIEIAKSLPY